MTRLARAIVGSVAVAGIAGWYLFRPERAFLNRSVSEPAPVGTVVVLLTGRFESRAHPGDGVAQLLEASDGQRALRPAHLATSNGPDLQVYLLGSAQAAGRADLAASGHVSLGALKANRGDQNYPIPPGTDFGRYGAVTNYIVTDAAASGASSRYQKFETVPFIAIRIQR